MIRILNDPDGWKGEAICFHCDVRFSFGMEDVDVEAGTRRNVDAALAARYSIRCPKDYCLRDIDVCGVLPDVVMKAIHARHLQKKGPDA